MAAAERARAVVKSDFILGFVIGFSDWAISATSLAFSATLSGTLAAWCSAASIIPSPFAESLPCLYAFMTVLKDSASASMAAFKSSRKDASRPMAALRSFSYWRYAFFPRDIVATMWANPAAMAALAAAALPPPGVAVGAA